MMKKSLFALLSGIAAVAIAPCYGHDGHHHDDKAVKVETSQAPKDVDIAKVSQAFGNFIGRTLNSPGIGIHFDIDAVIKGIRDGVAGTPPPMSEQEYEKAIAALQENAFNALAEKNLKIANEFIAEKAKAKDVVEIEAGKLYYEVLKKSDGPVAKEHSTPLINYTGKFADGTVFGSSDETGPITISLDHTIPGFSKGLIGMKKNEKRRLYIHPDLAYGTKGDLPPNALLIFDVEMVDPTASDSSEEAKKPTSDASDNPSQAPSEDDEHADEQADASSDIQLKETKIDEDKDADDEKDDDNEKDDDEDDEDDKKEKSKNFTYKMK